MKSHLKEFNPPTSIIYIYQASYESNRTEYQLFSLDMNLYDSVGPQRFSLSPTLSSSSIPHQTAREKKQEVERLLFEGKGLRHAAYVRTN